MPSLLQNRTEDILSQSNTSRDSSDLNKKLNFTLMDDKNLTNNEFIGIETCYDSDLQGGNSTLKNNVSFDKEKNMPKSRQRLSRKKQSDKSLARSNNGNESQNQIRLKNVNSLQSTLTKLKLAEINQSIQGKERSFLDKFDKTDERKKQMQLSSLLSNFQKYGNNLHQKRRSRSGSKFSGSVAKISVEKKGSRNLNSNSNVKSVSQVGEKQVKLKSNGKKIENPLNRSIELIQTMPRANSASQKKSSGKLNVSQGPNANFSLFRTFVGPSMYSGRGGSSQRKVQV